MLDVHNLLRGLLQYYICPSNGTVLRRHKARYPQEQAPLFYNHNSNVNAQGRQTSALQQQLEFQAKFFHSTPQVGRVLLASTTTKGYGHHGSCNSVVEGWGDEIAHYYVLEDMLKLDPGQLVWLYEHVTGTATSSDNGAWSGGSGGSKDTIQAFVAGVAGEWFENNGETFAETVAFVVGERGGDFEEVREWVEEGSEGVVRGAFV